MDFERLQKALKVMTQTLGLGNSFILYVCDPVVILKEMFVLSTNERRIEGMEVLYTIEDAITDVSILPYNELEVLYQYTKERDIKDDNGMVLFEKHLKELEKNKEVLDNKLLDNEIKTVTEFIEKNRRHDVIMCVDEKLNWQIEIPVEVLNSVEETEDGYVKLIQYLSDNLLVVEELSEATVNVNLEELLSFWQTDFIKASEKNGTNYQEEMNEFVSEIQQMIAEKNQNNCKLIYELLSE